MYFWETQLKSPRGTFLLVFYTMRVIIGLKRRYCAYCWLLIEKVPADSLQLFSAMRQRHSFADIHSIFVTYLAFTLFCVFKQQAEPWVITYKIVIFNAQVFIILLLNAMQRMRWGKHCGVLYSTPDCAFNSMQQSIFKLCVFNKAKFNEMESTEIVKRITLLITLRTGNSSHMNAFYRCSSARGLVGYNYW